MSADTALELEGFTFTDLFEASGLERLDKGFLDALKADVPAWHQRLLDYRATVKPLSARDTSELLLTLAPRVETYIAQLFGIERELAKSRDGTLAENGIQAFKKQFVQRRARRYRGTVPSSFTELDRWLSDELKKAGLDIADHELAVARFGIKLLDDKNTHHEAIEQLTQWCILARQDPAGQARVKDWTSFRLPQPVDYLHLVSLQKVPDDPIGRLQAEPSQLRRRDGFRLTDPRMSARAIQGEIHYCVYCHENDGDFCSKGFPAKKGRPDLGLKVNPLGVILTGCPLEEKVSEMHALKRDGHTIAALAVAMVDNPMVPVTGHRICNDCMKACIYQKQEPVNIPQIETRVLTDVLDLPWGVEIYDLLTRWNPLRQHQYRLKPYNGHRVLIAGMGPAGFTMAHHLTMEGCAVVGIDGLKIEPLPETLLGTPVRDYSSLEENLDERILAGFGGVAEYGITARWDKNFLKLIYLGLARRSTFQVFGGVRLGGTITLDDAWEVGFDHVCIANGAGLPRVIPMGNSLARGMRQANDFLMALQLTGAAKASSLANLQVRLPAVVIGGGLTAIDTATEVQAYYIAQVEKALARFEALSAEYGEPYVVDQLDAENRAILAEFLMHGRAVRTERERARAVGEQPDFISLIRSWGGVTLAYRRRLGDSPAYQRNHEEIAKAMEEGIYYLEGVEPVNAELDQYGHVKDLICRCRRYEDGKWVATGSQVALPARAVFVAAGATPNTIYEREHPGTFTLQDNHFQPHITKDTTLQPLAVANHCKAERFGPFTSYQKDGHRVSFIGDSHPVFHGSVVKAVASAQRSYPTIMAALAHGPVRQPHPTEHTAFRKKIEHLLTPRVAELHSDHPAVVELWAHAPLAARNFRPGQFFRLQTYERFSPVVQGTRLQIPLQTISGAGVKDDKVRLMVLKGGANPHLIERLRPGQALILMGPTGTPTEIIPEKTVLIVAGSWGAAVLLGLGPALRAANNRVLVFGAFRAADNLYCQDELEAGTDQIVWCTATDPLIPSRRPQDLSVRGGNIIELLHRYGEGQLKPKNPTSIILLEEVDEILVMGSTNLLRGLQAALRDELKDYFRPDVKVTGTVGSPMQCMLKGVCAQCLQWQINPATGERTRAVFSCANQDQPLFAIDLDNLAARQAQNRLPEHLTALWLDYVLAPNGKRRA